MDCGIGFACHQGQIIFSNVVGGEYFRVYPITQVYKFEKNNKPRLVQDSVPLNYSEMN